MRGGGGAGTNEDPARHEEGVVAEVCDAEPHAEDRQQPPLGDGEREGHLLPDLRQSEWNGARSAIRNDAFCTR